MTVAVLKSVLENVLGRNLTNAQVGRVASAFYTKSPDETNNEAADIVLNKLRRMIVARVKEKESQEAAETARINALQALDNELGAFDN